MTVSTHPNAGGSADAAPATIAPLRNAATLVVMRDAPQGLEVLLLRCSLDP